MLRLVLLGGLALAAPASAQSTFHGNVARTGVYDTPGPLRAGGIKWQFKAGGAKFQANATATAGDASRQAATNWSEGVAVFFKGKGGLIADASMGTQDFGFEPATPPPAPAKKKAKKG